MSSLLQDSAALAAVFIAVSFLAWRYRARARQSGCAGCGEARSGRAPALANAPGRVRLPVVSR